MPPIQPNEIERNADFYLIKENISVWITPSNIILFLTFLALVWYSLETRGMRIEIKKQNEQYALPLVFVIFEADPLSDRKYYFRNEGFGPALNIKLEDFPTDKKDDLVIYKSDICDFISPKGRSEIIFRRDDGNRLSKMFFPPPDKSYEIKVTYSNVHGVQYATIGKIVDRKPIIIKTERIK